MSSALDFDVLFYLLDAVRTFAGRRVTLGLRDGLKPTVLTDAEPHPDGLVVHYVLAPLVPAAR